MLATRYRSARTLPNVQTRRSTKQREENSKNTHYLVATFCNLWKLLGSDIEYRIQNELIAGEKRAKEENLLWDNGAADSEAVSDCSIEYLATLISPSKASKVLNKWLGEDVDAQALSREALAQLTTRKKSTPSPFAHPREIPKCVLRVRTMDSDTYFDTFTVNDAKEICCRFEAVTRSVEDRKVRMSAKQLKEAAHRLCEVYQLDGNHDEGFFDS